MIQEMLDGQYTWADLSDDTASDVVYLSKLFGQKLEYMLDMTPWKFNQIRDTLIKIKEKSGEYSPERSADLPTMLG